MILTIATFTNESGDEQKEGIRHVTEEVVPAISDAPGLRGGYWAVDREAGKRLSVMVWDSAEAMSAAMPEVMATIQRLRDEAGITESRRSPDVSERFEIIAQL